MMECDKFSVGIRVGIFITYLNIENHIQSVSHADFIFRASTGFLAGINLVPSMVLDASSVK